MKLLINIIPAVKRHRKLDKGEKLGVHGFWTERKKQIFFIGYILFLPPVNNTIRVYKHKIDERPTLWDIKNGRIKWNVIKFPRTLSSVAIWFVGRSKWWSTIGCNREKNRVVHSSHGCTEMILIRCDPAATKLIIIIFYELHYDYFISFCGWGGCVVFLHSQVDRRKQCTYHS